MPEASPVLKEDQMHQRHRHRPLLALAVGAVLTLAACSGGAAPTPPPAPASPAPSTAATPAPASAAPTPEPTADPAAAACTPGSAGGDVAVAIEDFTFNPAEISASVGQTVSFTNNDPAPHTATLDDGSCTTPNLSQGLAAGLTFSAAGTYPFFCKIHPSMTGTITVS